MHLVLTSLAGRKGHSSKPESCAHIYIYIYVDFNLDHTLYCQGISIIPFEEEPVQTRELTTKCFNCALTHSLIRFAGWISGQL